MKPFYTFLNASCSDDNFPGLIGLGSFKSNLSYPINLAISSIKSISLVKSCDLLGITATSQPYSLFFKVQPMSVNLSTISFYGEIESSNLTEEYIPKNQDNLGLTKFCGELLLFNGSINYINLLVNFIN